MPVLKYKQVENETVDQGQTKVVMTLSKVTGRLKQIAFELSGSVKMKESQLKVKYDGTNEVPLPKFKEVEQAIGTDSIHATYINIVKDDVNGAYGYSLVMDSQFESSAEVSAMNADQSKPMRVKCLLLYEE